MEQIAPRQPADSKAGFDRYGPAISASPVILSVPHAGRDYPPELLAHARVRPEVLRRLEDRWADLLVQPLIERGFTVLVSRSARALIDLNRHEREIDPAMVSGIPSGQSLQTSVKLRGGLGLLPRRLPGQPDLWRGPFTWADVSDRIETIHRPYHAAVTQLMRAARRAHGHAILIDLHSMPPLPPAAPGVAAPALVLGDRFGRSASGRLMQLAADLAQAHGFGSAQNHPYAGDHMIDRHGRPDRDMHAIQIEIDRSYYLDVTLDRPGPGLEPMQAYVTRLAQAMAVELPRADDVLAAE